MNINTSARAHIFNLLFFLITQILSTSIFAAETNLISVPIKLKGTYTQFKGSDGIDKSAPVDMKFLVVDEKSTPPILTLQPLGDIPNNSIPSTDLIDKYSRYTVDANNFKGYWEIFLQGAAPVSASSTANLSGSVLKLKSDFDGLIAPNGNHETIAKDSKLIVLGDDGEKLSLEVKTNTECEDRKISPGATKKSDMRSFAPATTCAEIGPKYTVTKSAFGPEYWNRTGVSYGPLFTPFKMRFKDKSLTGEAALGGYLGYEFRPWGISITPAVHAGLSVVTVGGDNSAKNNINDTASKPAFTWGFALIMKPGDNYQAGIVLGKDRIGGSDGAAWNYEGRWWLSIAIGYNFAR